MSSRGAIARGAAAALAILGLVGCGDDTGKPSVEAADAGTSPTDSADAIDDDATANDASVTETDTATTSEDIAVGDDAVDADDAVEIVPSTEPIPDDVEPCDEPRYWPYALRSAERPVTVHYRAPSEAAAARQVVGFLEQSWLVEVDRLGFRAPLPDDGLCGEDANMDVFLWRDAPEVYTNVLDANPATAWDDGPPYMVLDTIGDTAGEYLDATVAHEFNHACQAAYDWSDASVVYEMTSTFIEDEVYDDDDNYMDLLFDFQENPDWSIDRDDGYETFYMYGARLYLGYLRDRFYRGDASFAAAMWEGLRSAEADNEPDYEDALDELLAEFGKSFLDTVIEFQRWRWYVGARDDGRHLEEAGAYPDDTLPAVAAVIDGNATSHTLVRPMMLGATFVDVASGSTGAVSVQLQPGVGAPEEAVRFVVQALPGGDGDDGELVDLSSGSARVALVDGRRTLVVTALPGPNTSADPDDRSDDRYPATLTLAPASP